MNWQAFENNMRESAETHETPVDHEMLWQKIRQKKRRRRGILLWWFCGTVTAGSVVLFLLVKKSCPPENHRAQDAAIAAFAQPSQPEAATLNQYPDATAGIETSLGKIPDGQLPATESHQAPAIVNNTLTTAKTQTVQTDAKEMSTSSPAIVPTQLVPEVHSGSPDGNTPLFQKSTQSVEQQVLNTGGIPANITGLSKIPPAAQMWLFPYISPLRTPAVFSPEEVPADGRAVSARKKHHRNMHAGIEAGYAVWNINISRSDSNLLSRNGERKLETVSLALRGNFKVAGHFSISAGVQYSRFASVFNWQQAWEAPANPLITDTYIDGTVDSFYYWSPSLHQFERTVKNYNHIHTLNIPLDFQYAFSMGKWTVAPFAGIQPGFSFSAKGVIEGPDGKPSKDIFRDIYRNTLTISGRGGIYCSLPINEKLQISLAPTIVFDLTGRVKSSEFPQEKFMQAGVNVGLVRRFGF